VEFRKKKETPVEEKLCGKLNGFQFLSRIGGYYKIRNEIFYPHKIIK